MVILINSIAKEHVAEIENKVNSLIKKEFLSPIFSVPKKNNKVCLILNLKQLKQHIPYSHFKTG